jgi:hypothetical protein
LPTLPDLFRRLRLWTPGLAIDGELLAAAALLGAALAVGLSNAADYGLTVDEFNVDDYGPKALARYARPHRLAAPREGVDGGGHMMTRGGTA